MRNGKRGAGLFAGSVGIAAVVTAGFEPLEVLAGWLLAAALRVLVSECRGLSTGKPMGITTILAGIPIISGLLWAAERAFPQESTFPFVSICVLLLLYRSMIGEKESPEITANVLGLLILPLVAVIELSGINNLDWIEILPKQISLMHILIAAGSASPWWTVGKAEKGWGWFGVSGAAAVLMSVLCAGILGKGLLAHTNAPLYRAVQGIELFGKPLRMEALLAAATLMGVITAVMWMGTIIRNAVEEMSREENRRKWYGGILTAAFLIELGMRYMRSDHALYRGIWWGFVLAYGLWVAISEKVGKSEKSP